jgi:hypothetical protein
MSNMLYLAIHFNDDLELERIADASEVFREQIDRALHSGGPGPNGAWGYGKVYVQSVTVRPEDAGSLAVLRELHRYLYPELYPESERPEGADSEWSPSTIEGVAAMVEQALAGDPQLRTAPA